MNEQNTTFIYCHINDWEQTALSNESFIFTNFTIFYKLIIISMRFELTNLNLFYLIDTLNIIFYEFKDEIVLRLIDVAI